MSAGANKRVKLFSALNVLGWVVVMPALLVAVMSPFVNFSAWPEALADRASGTHVALMPPRLSEHGSLPQLTDAPPPSAAVPVHRQIAATFTSAPAPASRSARRAQGRRPASARRQGSAPARSRRPVTGGSGRPALRTPAAVNPVLTPTVPSLPLQSAATPQPKPEQSRPDEPAPGHRRPDDSRPPDPAPSKPGKDRPQNQGNGNADKGQDPQQAGAGKTGGAQDARSGDPDGEQPGNGNGRRRD